MFYMFHMQIIMMIDIIIDRDYDYRMTKPNSYSIPNEFNLR